MAKKAVTTAATDERSEMRLEIAVAAGLRTAQGRRVRITLCNMSVYGFMAEGGTTLVPGLPVTLDLLDGNAFEARIVWRRGGYIGGTFAKPIDAAALAAIV